jgi:enterochelin esterase family protein
MTKSPRKALVHLSLLLAGAAMCRAAEPASPPRTTDNVEFIIGPVYADAPELTVKDGVPKGEIHEFVMKSEDSKIYKGIAKGQKGTVPYERKVAVYVPKQLDTTKPAPFIVAQDGLGYLGVLPKALDNLIHEKRVPAMVAIMINSGGGDAQGSQRGLEYDTVSGLYAEFIEKEVLPKVAKDYDLKFTADPDGRATMGAVRVLPRPSPWRGSILNSTVAC